MVHQYKLNGYNIVLDSESGSVHTVDDAAYDTIELYGNTPEDEIVSIISDRYSISADEVREILDDIETLKSVCEDKIHEKYRASLIPNFNDIKKIALINNAICAYLSGAGPTIMCIVESSNSTFKDNMTNYLKTLDINWTIRELMVCNEGTTIEYINN